MPSHFYFLSIPIGGNNKKKSKNNGKMADGFRDLFFYLYQSEVTIKKSLKTNGKYVTVFEIKLFLGIDPDPAYRNLVSIFIFTHTGIW